MFADQILDQKGRMVATIAPEATVADAVAALAQHNVGALVVSTDGARVEGIVSERDIVRRMAVAGASTLAESIQLITVTDVATIGGHTHVDEMMDLMTERRIRHLPVLDGDGRLCGIVSIGDVVRTRIDELAAERAQLVDYIRTGR